MSATSSSSVAAGLLRIGQSVLFGALLVIGVVRGVGDRGWPVALAGGAIAALFVAGLVTHRRLGPKGRAVWVVTLLVATVALMPMSPDFVWLAFPVWMWVAHVVSLPLALALTATSVAMAIAVLNQHGQSSSAAVLGPIIGALVAVGLARGALRLEQEGQEHRSLLARVLEAQAEADALSDELVRAQREAAVNAERTRLAHDIHDTLAQGFSSILLLTRAATRETDPERTQELLTQIGAAAAENLTESRRVVYALAPDDLTTGGLAAPLSRMTTELAAQLNAEVTIDIDPHLPRLHTATEVAILRGAQGALANVRRHANAGHVHVTLARAEDQVRLDIVDDGVGFNPTSIAAEPTLAGGYGLRALRERLATIGGGLAIESEPGQGTAISVTVPFAPAAGVTP
ncbi:MAG: sensor histidine kinase [Propionibacteriaceae bacterium]|nr:sensor histidine kinase [Propionibacteriaceae bacterium]